MITGSAPTGSSTAADLRPGADMHPLTDLRAGSHEGVRVDQAVLADICADVDEHRGHTDHPCAHIRAVANRGSARHQPDPRRRVERLEWQRVLVEKRHPGVRPGDWRDLAAPEANQDALLDPDVHPPPGGRGGVRHGGSDAALRQLGPEGREHGAGLLTVRVRACRVKTCNGRRERRRVSGQLSSPVGDV